jgi:phage tail-like protein
MAELALPALVLEGIELARPAAAVMLANRAPEPSGTGVPRSATIALELLGLQGAPIGPERVEIEVQGRPAYQGASGPPFFPAFAGPRSELEQVPGGLRITLDPLVPLLSEEDVQVRIIVLLEDGQTWEERYAFAVEDVTSPRLLAAEAISATRIALSFNEPVLVDVLEATFDALDLPAVPLRPLGASADGGRLELDVAPAMTADVRYRLTIRGVVDALGNAIASPDNVAVFRGYRPPRPPNRRFALWSMLPRYNRRDDTTGDLRKLVACLQEVLDHILLEIDRFGEILDLERAPEQFVDLMLAEVGNPFPFVLNAVDKRRLAAILVELYRLKGTEKGIRNAARFFLGIELGAITTYSGSPLILGESLLGVDWELGPSNRFALYAFEVHVPVELTDEQRARLRSLILWSKPAHTHLIDIVGPTVVIVLDEWVLGESEIGVNTILV